jgi:hypothetical protein
MEKLFELYEMVSMNDSVLRGTEKQMIQQARMAMRVFERAMRGFSAQAAHPPSEVESQATPETHLRMVATPIFGDGK